MAIRKEQKVVQVKNPRSGHWVKVNTSAGKIVGHKSSSGPYKGIPIAKKTSPK